MSESNLVQGFAEQLSQSWIDDGIALHANDFFRGFVGSLPSELAAHRPTLNAQQKSEAGHYFQRTVQLEREFFDYVYE